MNEKKDRSGSYSSLILFPARRCAIGLTAVSHKLAAISHTLVEVSIVRDIQMVYDFTYRSPYSMRSTGAAPIHQLALTLRDHFARQ